MSGGATSLGRDWFASCQDFYKRQARDRPDDLGTKFEEYFATSRLLATDVTLLLAAKSRDEIGDEEFSTRVADLSEQHAIFEHTLQTVFADQATYVVGFSKAPPPTDADITDFRDEHFLYSGELFTMNFVMIDFWAIDLMFKHHLTSFRKGTPLTGLAELALKQCKMFEAIQYCDSSPPGAIIGCQASLGMASLFLPKDEKHIGWCRRKFALIEQKGYEPLNSLCMAAFADLASRYIYPSALRERMSGVWGVDVNHWWLPDDEGYPAIVRSIRDFIEYRARVPAGNMDAQVQNMSGLFRGLDVEDDSVDGSSMDQSSPELDRSSSYETTPEQS